MYTMKQKFVCLLIFSYVTKDYFKTFGASGNWYGDHASLVREKNCKLAFSWVYQTCNASCIFCGGKNELVKM
jgi:hypothetical protein